MLTDKNILEETCASESVLSISAPRKQSKLLPNAVYSEVKIIRTASQAETSSLSSF
jgi:hypothetical protein